MKVKQNRRRYSEMSMMFLWSRFFAAMNEVIQFNAQLSVKVIAHNIMKG